MTRVFALLLALLSSFFAIDMLGQGRTSAAPLNPCYASSQQNRFDDAIRDCTAAISGNPADPGFYEARAYAHANKKNAVLAIADFTKSLELFPGNSRALTLRGSVYSATGRIDLAMVDYTAAIKLDPTNLYALFQRADVYNFKGDKASAIADLQAILRVSPNEPTAKQALARLQGTPAAGAPAFQFLGTTLTTPAEFMQTVANIEADIADDMAFSGDPTFGLFGDQEKEKKFANPDLLKVLIGCVSRFPDDFPCAKKLLGNYEELRNTETFKKRTEAKQIEALLIPLYTALLKKEPTNSGAYFSRGSQYFFAKKDYAAALADLDKAIELAPSVPSFYFDLRARVHTEAGHVDAAIKDWTKLIEVSPKSSTAYKERSTLYRDQKKYDLALSDINKAIETESYPSLKPWHVFRRGLIYNSMEKYDLAVTDFTEVLVANPTTPELFLARAKAYRGLGKTALADSDEAKAKDAQKRSK